MNHRHPRRHSRIAGALFAILLLNACASTPPASADAAPSSDNVVTRKAEEKTDRQGQRVGDRVDQKVDEETDQAVDSVLDKALGRIFGQ